MILTLLKLAIASALILWLYTQGTVDPAQLQKAAGIPLTLSIAVICLLVSYTLVAIRWHLLLRLKGLYLSFSTVFQVSMIGMFFNSFLPGGVGGDAVRIGYLFRSQPGDRPAAILSVLFDRLMGLCGLVTLLALILVADISRVMAEPLLASIAMLVMGSLLSLLCLYLLLNHTKLMRPLERKLENKTLNNSALDSLPWRVLGIIRTVYQADPQQLLLLVMLSTLVHAVSIGAMIILAQAMAFDTLSYLNYSLATAGALIANLLPLSPGGLGIGEAAFDNLCQLLTPESDQRVVGYASLFLIFRVVTLIASLPGACIYLVYRHHSPSPVATRKQSL